MARAVHMQHAYAFRLYEGLQEGGYLITYLVVSISEMIIDYFPSARCFSTLFGQKGQEQLVMDCWTPKQSQLAVGKHFSWSSTSILEGSHCLSPPGGLHAERAAGVPVRQRKKKTSVKIIRNFLHQLLAVLTGQKKQALPFLLDSCLHITQQIYDTVQNRCPTAPTEKNQRCNWFFLGPRFWNTYWLFSEGAASPFTERWIV